MTRRTSTARVREPAPVIDLAEARSRRAARAHATATATASAASAASAATVATCAIAAPVLRLPVARPSVAPMKPRGGVRQHFGELRGALADGWEIVQPIFARPLWTVPDDSATAFNFVLRRASDTRLVTVPEGRTITRFIRDRQLTVDYRQ